MKWSVKINEARGNILAETLAAAGFKLDGDIISRKLFEALDTPEDVADLAHDLAHIVREIGRLNSDIEIGFFAGPVLEFGADGEQTAEHAIVRITGAAALAITTYPPTIINTSLSPEEQAEIDRRERIDKASELLRAMMADESVHTVMTLLGGEPTPFDMWKAWELMRDDIRVDKNELKRFKPAIHDPRVAGDLSRHAKAEGKLPDNPMSVSEAVAFIRRAADQWIKNKSDVD